MSGEGDKYSGGGYSPRRRRTSLSPPPLLTSSGGHQNMYGWQAGGKYPTGMLSFLPSITLVAER